VNKNIFITGSTGFVCSNIIAKYTNYNFIIFNRNEPIFIDSDIDILLFIYIDIDIYTDMAYWY
jgi:nucleoside-diphosphate-sugar epimerase